MSEILGFSNGRHPYFKFENAITKELDRLFQNELDPVIKEMTRLQEKRHVSLSDDSLTTLLRVDSLDDNHPVTEWVRNRKIFGRMKEIIL